MKRAIRLAIITLFFIPAISYGQCTLNPPLDLGQDTSGCTGSSITLDAGGSYINYLWSTGASSQSITVTQSGLYWVRVTDGFGCVGEDSINVSITSNLSVDLGPDIDTCEGAIVVLDAGAGPYVYQWQDGSTDRQLAVTQSGSYWVQITDGNSCDASDTVNVTFHPFPVVTVTASQTMFCEGDSAVLMADSGHASYMWSNGDTNQSTVVMTTGNYSCTVTSAAGCGTVSSALAITVWAQPAQPVITEMDDHIMSTAGDIYVWFFDSTMVDSGTNQMYTPVMSGNHYVQIISNDGCVSPLSAAFEVLLGLEEEDFPQFISPNGDGMNDVFRINDITNVPDNILVIRNRWGSEIYRAEPYNNDWNGQTAGGKDVPAGTYYYFFDVKDGSKPFSGYFELTR